MKSLTLTIEEQPHRPAGTKSYIAIVEVAATRKSTPIMKHNNVQQKTQAFSPTHRSALNKPTHNKKILTSLSLFPNPSLNFQQTAARQQADTRRGRARARGARGQQHRHSRGAAAAATGLGGSSSIDTAGRRQLAKARRQNVWSPARAWPDPRGG